MPEADIYIRAKQYGGPGEAVFIEGETEEVGRVSKMVYSYVKEVNNGYILAKKGKLSVGDKIKFMDMMPLLQKKLADIKTDRQSAGLFFMYGIIPPG